MFKKTGVFCIALMVLAQSASAMAWKDPKATIGATGGLGLGLNPVGASWRAGLNGHYFLMPRMSLGLQVLVYAFGTGVSGIFTTSTFSVQPMVQGRYYVWEGLNVGLDVGAGLGFSSTQILANPATSSFSGSFAFGPAVGFDFPLMDMLSVGADVSVYFNTSAFANPSLNALGNVKYRF